VQYSFHVVCQTQGFCGPDRPEHAPHGLQKRGAGIFHQMSSIGDADLRMRAQPDFYRDLIAVVQQIDDAPLL
jgi:hypothetical protein